VIAVKRAMKSGRKNSTRLGFALKGTRFAGVDYDIRG